VRFFKRLRKPKPPREHVEIARELHRRWNAPKTLADEVEASLEEASNALDRIQARGAARNRAVQLSALRENKVLADVFISWSHREEVETSRAETLRKVESTFSVVELMIPPKLRGEEIGDALEEINRMAVRPDFRRWRVWLKVASTCFWVAVNAVRQVSSAILGKKAE
jgi:hypothetical protein